MMRNLVGLQVRSYLNSGFTNSCPPTHPPIMGGRHPKHALTMTNNLAPGMKVKRGPYLPNIVWEVAKHKNSILKPAS